MDERSNLWFLATGNFSGLVEPIISLKYIDYALREIFFWNSNRIHRPSIPSSKMTVYFHIEHFYAGRLLITLLTGFQEENNFTVTLTSRI